MTGAETMTCRSETAYKKALNDMVWSYSRVNSYVTCPNQFKDRYLDRLPRVGNAFSDWGLWGHQLLEEYYNGELTFFDLTDKYCRHYKEQVVHEFPPNPYVDLGEVYYHDGKSYFDNFCDDYYGATTLGVEQKVAIDIEGRPFTGVIDLLVDDKTGIILCDHKSKKAFKSKGEKDAYLRQLYLYSLYVKEQYGEFPYRLDFNLIRSQRIIATPFEKQGLIAAKKWFLGNIDEIYQDKWFMPKPDTFFCDYLCGTREHCAMSNDFIEIKAKRGWSYILIEQEKIREAKEKLGSRGFDLIMEILGVEEYDSKNLKSICPFHTEDTPSFIWNPKSNNAHCFGCQKTVDVIDALVATGHTYLEAVQKLFEYAETPYSFGELQVKTRPQYRYPKEVRCDDKSAVYAYAVRRKISRETIDYADVRQDEHGNVVFNYYDLNDTLTMVKYRPSRKVARGENKCWCQRDADTTPLLFNMHKINVNNDLLICTGEFDCLSAIEAGFTNAVSIPLGDGNTHWVEENWAWLEQFKGIIICADNDESGRKFEKDIVYRLGSWRCKIVDLPVEYKRENGSVMPIKDLNEVLYLFGKEKVLKLITHAKDSPVESVIDFSDIQEVNLSEIDGIYTGIQEFDRELMRLFYGTFNILTGVNGSGKSSYLSQLICQCLDQERDAWLYSKELPNYMSKNWINYILSGPRNVKEYISERGSLYYEITNEAKKKIDAFYRGRLYIDFAQKFHVVVMLVIHPRKIETMRRLQKFDVAGLGSIVDLAHRLISLYRVTPEEKEGIRNASGDGWHKDPIRYDVILDILKDRLRGRENLSIGLYYDNASRRFFTNAEELDYQYKWDDTVYTKQLAYPIKDPEDEIFGAHKVI